jgi:hypothetical protein
MLLLSGVPLTEPSPHKISSCSYGAYGDYNELLFYENSAEYAALFISMVNPTRYSNFSSLFYF